MSKITLKIKKLVEEAVIPSYAKQGDAGLDLTAVSKQWDDNLQCWVYGTGLAFEIPEGHVGLLFPRSSVRKTNLALTNSVGVVDSGYRGEAMFTYRPQSNGISGSAYNVGDRVGQLIVMEYPTVEIEEVTDLADSERGTGGHGSTGK